MGAEWRQEEPLLLPDPGCSHGVVDVSVYHLEERREDEAYVQERAPQKSTG